MKIVIKGRLARFLWKIRMNRFRRLEKKLCKLHTAITGTKVSGIKEFEDNDMQTIKINIKRRKG